MILPHVLSKETDATLRKEQVQIVYEIVCIVFGEDRFRPSLPELLTVCKVSFGHLRPYTVSSATGCRAPETAIHPSGSDRVEPAQSSRSAIS